MKRRLFIKSLVALPVVVALKPKILESCNEPRQPDFITIMTNMVDKVKDGQCIYVNKAGMDVLWSDIQSKSPTGFVWPEMGGRKAHYVYFSGVPVFEVLLSAPPSQPAATIGRPPQRLCNIEYPKKSLNEAKLIKILKDWDTKI